MANDAQSRQLAVLTQSDALQKREAEIWLSTHLPQGGAELGVSRRYIVNMVTDFHLTAQDLDIIVDARLYYNAAVSAMRSLLADGLSVAEVHGVYTARQEVIDTFRQGEQTSHVPSLIGIIRFCTVFPQAKLDSDELGSLLVETWLEVKEQFSKMEYFDQAIALVCNLAKGCKITNLETAMAYLHGELYDDIYSEDEPLDSILDYDREEAGISPLDSDEETPNG